MDNPMHSVKYCYGGRDEVPTTKLGDLVLIPIIGTDLPKVPANLGRHWPTPPVAC